MDERQVLKLLAAMNNQKRSEIYNVQAEDGLASPFGCCNFFDNCADQILSLYYKGKLDLLDWLNFNVTEDCYRSVEFISFVRPEQYLGKDTSPCLDACEDPNGIEYGECKITVEDFGRIGREGPSRDLYKPTRYCKLRPKYFLDGSPVTNEFDWDMIFTADQLLNDLRVLLISSTVASCGFDGLNEWINTGKFDCPALDSHVIDWNHNGFDGGAGVTINGAPATGVYNIVDYLLDIHRNVKERISWSPVLSNQKREVGDTIIMLPSFLGRALLDYYTCWSVCPAASYSSQISVSLKDQREFRLTLDGGLFGHGKIYLDGDEIPLLFYDWNTITGPTSGDIYYLTGSVGSQRIWEGEHLDANIAMKQLKDLSGNPGDYFSRDGGRVMGKVDFYNTCRTLKLWLRPRLFCLAPWAQARFQDVKAGTPLGPLSPNPADTSFFPMDSSFSAAVCPGMSEYGRIQYL